MRDPEKCISEAADGATCINDAVDVWSQQFQSDVAPVLERIATDIQTTVVPGILNTAKASGIVVVDLFISAAEFAVAAAMAVIAAAEQSDIGQVSLALISLAAFSAFLVQMQKSLSRARYENERGYEERDRTGYEQQQQQPQPQPQQPQAQPQQSQPPPQPQYAAASPQQQQDVGGDRYADAEYDERRRRYRGDYETEAIDRRQEYEYSGRRSDEYYGGSRQEEYPEERRMRGRGRRYRDDDTRGYRQDDLRRAREEYNGRRQEYERRRREYLGRQQDREYYARRRKTAYYDRRRERGYDGNEQPARRRREWAMDRRRWGDVRYDDRMRGRGYDDRARPPPRYDERAPRPTRYDERGPSRYGPPPQYDETDMQPQEGYQPQGMYGGGWWEAQERGDMPPQTYDGGYGGYATEIDRPVPVTWVDQQEAMQNAKAPEARPPPQRPTAPPPQERPPQSTSPTEPPPATPAPEVLSEMNQPGADLEEFVRVGRNWVRLINGTATESSPADVVGRVVPVAAAGALRDAATTFEGWQEAAAMAAEKAQAAAEAKAAEEAAAKAAETLAAAEAAVKAAEAAKAKSTATAAPDTTSRRDVLLKQQAKELKPNPGAPQPSSTGRASKQQVIGTQSSVTDAAARMRRRQRGRANPNPPRDVPPPQRIDERIVEAGLRGARQRVSTSVSSRALDLATRRPTSCRPRALDPTSFLQTRQKSCVAGRRSRPALPAGRRSRPRRRRGA